MSYWELLVLMVLVKYRDTIAGMLKRPDPTDPGPFVPYDGLDYPYTPPAEPKPLIYLAHDNSAHVGDSDTGTRL